MCAGGSDDAIDGAAHGEIAGPRLEGLNRPEIWAIHGQSDRPAGVRGSVAGGGSERRRGSLSTLTKVFTVLLALFSIAFTVLTVSAVAQTTNWRETADKYQQYASVVETNYRNVMAATSAELAAARDEANAHLDRVAKLEGDLQATRNDLAEARADLAKIESEKTSADAMNRALVAQLEAAEKARSEFQTQRDGLEHQVIDFQRRNVDLNDRVNELTARIAVVLEEKRHFEQQINILREENQRLSQATRTPSRGLALEEPSGQALPGVQALTPVPVSPIRGHVVAVSGDLVTFSVGSADGVRKDMVFVVHRDGAYIGDVRVDVVEPNRAAGRMIRSSGKPQNGDQVQDAVSLASSRG